jgi:hypothetical protein
MEPKPLRFHKTERANNHIEQDDAILFARHPVSVTDNQLSTMLTISIHIHSVSQGLCLIKLDY